MMGPENPPENPFNTHFREYDDWYERHRAVYESELRAVRALMPPGEVDGVEVGVGSGRFAAPLGIRLGVDPAEGIASLARERGITVLPGTAEDLPLDDGGVDLVLYATSLCFLSDLRRAFDEAHRVLRDHGCVVAAFLPLDGPLGQAYAAHAATDPFFRCAHFRTVGEVHAALRSAGFKIDRTVQTLVPAPEGSPEAVQDPVEGWGGGSFVVSRAYKAGGPDAESAYRS